VCLHVQLFDEENNGYINFKNLKKICQELGENLCVLLASWSAGQRHVTLALSCSTDDEIQEMIEEADRNGDERVSTSLPAHAGATRASPHRAALARSMPMSSTAS
jgi:hypothetical protein